MKLLITQRKKYVIADPAKDYHCQEGYIRAKDIVNGEVTTSTGVKGLVIDAGFADMFSRLRRGPQIITPKDIGWILAKTFVGRDSVVVDAGSGSGALAVALARYVKKVYSCDIREDHLKIATENAVFIGQKNIVFRQMDVYESFPKVGADLVVLDLAEPHRCVDHLPLKEGGYVVGYVPCTNQMHDFVNALTLHGLLVLETVELIERQWKVAGLAIRPETQNSFHTGFLVLGRKI